MGTNLLFPPGTPGLERVPYEIMAQITSYLDLVEIFDLSSCSHSLQYLIREENFCRAVITAKAPHTLEGLEAFAALEAHSSQPGRSFSRAVRRLVKRWRALSEASPYFVGMIGLAQTYELIRGQLCYISSSSTFHCSSALPFQTYKIVTDTSFGYYTTPTILRRVCCICIVRT
ncbi:hypothetical protein F4778DRAFT_698148 [Xylariomycetidae sp. FL2044]|nr:hypothetical protein F4778DRAFT_698148 [Xylariomycetidae sp. FL2044]